jgi:hypothetical protein
MEQIEEVGMRRSECGRRKGKLECGRRKKYENGKLGGCELGEVERCEDGRRKNRMQKS